MGTANHLMWVAIGSGALRLVHWLDVYILCRMAARFEVDIETRPVTSYLRITKTAAEAPQGPCCTGHGARCPVEKSQDDRMTSGFAETQGGSTPLDTHKVGPGVAPNSAME